MEKIYVPEDIEASCYKNWETSGYFKPNNNNATFCTMLPPPNVTGSLHMGHGFEHTLSDILVRYERMQGKAVLWQCGTDHAGIATQMVVERQLQAKGQTRAELGREAFSDAVWQWKEESGGQITQQMRRLGTSPDWSRERFTMDEGLSKAVKKAFVQLHQEGLIYRKKRLINWDPTFKTAISDLEVNSVEEQGHLWHIAYRVCDSDEQLVVATTRPETLLGDVAVAVHPEDERYQHLIGHHVQLPLCERTIPIIADDYVDREFGTGCLKITPAHDFNDYDVGQRHDLPLLNIFNPDATVNDNAPEAYRRLERYEARQCIVADLEAQGLLIRTVPHTLMVPHNDRGGAIIEPYLTDQWFVRVESLAKEAIDAVESGRIELRPESAKNTYFEWMNNIQDWCISRQLWWGHRIPAWYAPDGDVYVGESEAEIRDIHNISPQTPLTQDDDVLDTWFSAGLFPFSTLGWPDEQSPELKRFYPTSVLITGFDLIFFWVARMIMFGLKFAGDVPFRTVYFHGLIRDHEGQKMSKSKGNVLDPVDLIDGIDLPSLLEKRTYGMMQPKLAERIIAATRKEFPDGINAHGTDALRFTYAALASTSRDICFDAQRMLGYRNFCNKIWNAGRFIDMQCQGEAPELTGNPSAYDTWIRHALNDTILTCHKALEEFRFDRYANALYDFTWSQFCDWYLEFAKISMKQPEHVAHTRQTMLKVFEALLRLLHPVMPFITEHLWQAFKPLTGATGDSIMTQAYPQFSSEVQHPDLAAEVERTCELISALRTLRSGAQIPPKQMVPCVIRDASTTQRDEISRHWPAISTLVRAENLNWLEPNESIEQALTCVHAGLLLVIPLTGLVDKDQEQARLLKEKNHWLQEIDRASAKLNNPNFTNKAPPAVVAKQQEKVNKAQEALAQIESQLHQLETL